MDPYDNYIDLLLEKGLSAKSDEELAVAIDRENGKREKDEALDAVCGEGTAEILSVLPEPIFFDHFQMLARTMEITRK